MSKSSTLSCRLKVLHRRSWGLGLAVLLLLAGASCRQDMHDQPKFKNFRASDFYPDARSARPYVEGTVARGHLRVDERFYTGKQGGDWIAAIPLPVNRILLERGKDRYSIYCTPCHDSTGSGRGMIVRRGFRQPPSYHIDRLRQIPIGYFYDVMTNGFGAMAGYSERLSPEDRWAIAAYIRVLQLSQHAKADNLPPEALRQLQAK